MKNGFPVSLAQVGFCCEEMRNSQLLLGKAYPPQTSHRAGYATRHVHALFERYSPRN